MRHLRPPATLHVLDFVAADNVNRGLFFGRRRLSARVFVRADTVAVVAGGLIVAYVLGRLVIGRGVFRRRCFAYVFIAGKSRRLS